MITKKFDGCTIKVRAGRPCRGGTTLPPPAGTIQLSDPQIELLTDIADHPMFITQWSRWDRTAQALIRRKLARQEGGHHTQYEIRITEAGREEATRRRITVTVGSSGE